MYRLALGLHLALAVGVGFAAEISGIVTDVHDGDTITIVNPEENSRIRLVDIDAPELKQERGKDARVYLFHLCGLKRATVQTTGGSRDGHTLATVTCAGIDAGAEMVRQGWAWVYEEHAPKDSPLYQIQDEAKAARRGLWSDDAPVPPWAWRQQK